MKPQKHPNPLSEYIGLLEAFIEGRIDAQTFEQFYLERFKSDTTRWPEGEYQILNDLFGDIDAFCAEPELRGPEDLDETQLRERSATALDKLRLIAVS
jgi:self-protective colicin-like immunity protein